MRDTLGPANRTKAAVLSELIRLRFRVLIPFEDGLPYDMALDLGDQRLVRIQIKTARLRSGVVIFSTSSVTNRVGGHVKINYKGKIEVFVAYCEELGRFFAMDVTEAGVYEARLRVLEPKTTNQWTQKIKWADSYVLSASSFTKWRANRARREPRC